MNNHPILGADYPLNTEVTDKIASWGVDIYAFPPPDVTRTIHPPTDIPPDDVVTGKAYLVNILTLMLEDDTFVQPFKDDIQALINYFSQTFSIPVYFLKGNGYDYIISSKGIDLVAPIRPGALRDSDGSIQYRDSSGIVEQEEEFKRELYRLYQMRKVGRKPIVIPPENPAGIVPGFDDKIRTVRMMAADNNIEALLSLKIEGDYSELSTESGETYTSILETLQSLMLCCIEPDPCFDCRELPKPKPCNCEELLQVIYCKLEELKKDLTRTRELSITCYTETLERRCWYLPGSVFRTIADELPRMKARIWMDQLSGVTDQLDAYKENANDGCRKLFESYLEISLPKCEKMFFAGPDMDIPGMLLPYNPNAIYIHNYGITLPKVGRGPIQKQIYASWRSGASANPVFTDSSNTCS